MVTLPCYAVSAWYIGTANKYNSVDEHVYMSDKSYRSTTP